HLPCQNCIIIQRTLSPFERTGKIHLIQNHERWRVASCESLTDRNFWSPFFSAAPWPSPPHAIGRAANFSTPSSRRSPTAAPPTTTPTLKKRPIRTARRTTPRTPPPPPRTTP